MRRGLRILLLGTALISAGACGSDGGRATTDPFEVAKEFGIGGGGKAYRLDVAGLGESYRFAYHDRGDGTPCIAYLVPGSGGGRCFVAVGDRGGWALEAELIEGAGGAVVIGATVKETDAIRIGPDPVAGLTVKPRAVTKQFGVRFLVATVPAAALKVPANDIVALDREGRLLGRQHDNDGKGGFGARDGRWEIEFDRRSAGG